MNTFVVNKLRTNLRLILLTGTAVLLLFLQLAAQFPGVTTPIERFEYSSRDLMMRMRGVQPPSGEIVIVAIDDFSFNWTGYQWPWPRTYLAEVVDQLNAGGARVIGVDIFLFEPDQDPVGDEALSSALGKSSASVSVLQIFEDVDLGVSTIRFPLTPYRDALTGTGITGFRLDEDAIIRSVQAYDTYGNDIYYHWSFELARQFLNTEPPSNSTDTHLTFNGRTIPLRNSQMIVNFAGPANTYPTYSAANVHDGITLEENPEAFRDKIVLIGATTVTLQDIYPTPFSAQNPTPGVEVVANAVDTLIHGAYFRQIPPWLGLLITIAAAVAAIWITRSGRPGLTITWMSIAMLSYALLAYLLYTQFRIILPLVTPEAMIFLGVVLPTLEQAVSQELEKRRVRSLFSRFISSEMVDQMMATQDLNSLNKRANVTMLFSDIRGFTTLSEKLSPENVVALLNPYLEAMTDVIHQHGGTVDKYEGDAIVAFFGEPVAYADHAKRALDASLEMRRELERLRATWEREGRPNQIEMGIGINSGEVFVGLLGSAQRINYTVIGDNANLASRIQDLTKTYSWPVLISESTYQQIKNEFDAELADSVLVKGRTQPVNVYKLIGRKNAGESEKIKSWL